MSSRVLVLPALQELEELLCSPLLEETHERTLDRLHLRGRHLGDLAITIDEAACDLLELEVAGDVGVDENLGQLSRRDDELGDEVDGVVTVAAQVFWGRLVWPELAIQLRTVVSARGLAI